MTEPESVPGEDRFTRHYLVDRIFHWCNALAVFVLLGTSLLPILGYKFPWVTAHWIAGVVLAALVVYHVIRALFWQDPWSMMIGKRDIVDAFRAVRWVLRLRTRPPGRPGKYPLLQKLFHHIMALAMLALIATGGLMLAKIDTPYWTRDPYFLSAGDWGIVYVVHDLSALTVLAMVMVHIYFAIRPEKLWITRSMILGWITRREYETHHDPAQWQASRVAERPVDGLREG